MEHLQFVWHPTLSKFVRDVKANEYLFQQGEIAETMIIILDGVVQLIGERNGGSYVASLLHPGDFLGEKVLLQAAPYQRTFSAMAESDAMVLEISPDHLKNLEMSDPATMAVLHRSILQIVTGRFERQNHLVRLLRSSNNVERLVHLILYFSRVSGRKFPGGTEVHLNLESIHTYIDMETDEIERCLSELVSQRLLLKQDGDRYLVPNEQKLMGYLPKLKQQQAA